MELRSALRLNWKRLEPPTGRRDAHLIQVRENGPQEQHPEDAVGVSHRTAIRLRREGPSGSVSRGAQRFVASAPGSRIAGSKELGGPTARKTVVGRQCSCSTGMAAKERAGQPPSLEAHAASSSSGPSRNARQQSGGGPGERSRLGNRQVHSGALPLKRPTSTPTESACSGWRCP